MNRLHNLWFLLVLGGLLLAGAALASCAPDTTAPELQVKTEQPDAPSVQANAATPANAEPGIATVVFTDQACLDCHTDQDRLKELAVENEVKTSSSGPDLAGDVSELETWQKILINGEGYSKDVHAFINCTACHGGEAVDDVQSAHTGLIADPAADPETGCGSCHPDIVPAAATSLHYTLAGFDTALHARSSQANYAALDQAAASHCDSCHTTCSDCHVSQPEVAGGGLIEGHVFVKTPLMNQSCTACHYSRVQQEYFGLNEGIPADVHEQAGLTCTSCHSGSELHGLGETTEVLGSSAGGPKAKCESCHADQVGVGSSILQHEIHGTEILPCQACHSVAYTNCTNCHLERAADGAPSYTLEASSSGFYLGRNVQRSTDRPWRFVPVRHVPIDINTFDQYGDDLLDNFLNRPTWVYTTPHNIQRQTPQTQSCTTCHGNNAIFLTTDKVPESERAGANLNVIVESAPVLPDNWQQVMAEAAGGSQAGPWSAPTATAVPGAGNVSSFWTARSTPTPANTGAGENGTPTPTAAGESDTGFWGGATSTPTPSGAGEDSTGFWGGSGTPTPTESGFWGK